MGPGASWEGGPAATAGEGRDWAQCLPSESEPALLLARPPQMDLQLGGSQQAVTPRGMSWWRSCRTQLRGEQRATPTAPRRAARYAHSSVASSALRTQLRGEQRTAQNCRRARTWWLWWRCVVQSLAWAGLWLSKGGHGRGGAMPAGYLSRAQACDPICHVRRYATHIVMCASMRPILSCAQVCHPSSHERKHAAHLVMCASVLPILSRAQACRPSFHVHSTRPIHQPPINTASTSIIHVRL